MTAKLHIMHTLIPILLMALIVKANVALCFSVVPITLVPRSSSADALNSLRIVDTTLKSCWHPLIQNQDGGELSSSYHYAGNSHSHNHNHNIIMRRSLLLNVLSASSVLLLPTTFNSAAASSSIPSVTSAEFDIILKDSAKSIYIVELSGPKSESAIVKLVDGTIFSISDLIESPTDPRSPLKLVARCRLYKVPVKNTGLLSAVSTTGEGSIISNSGKKKKSYMNSRVQEAERKEKEKRERMMEDERERLAELYRMETSETRDLGQ